MFELYFTKWKEKGLISLIFSKGWDPKLIKPHCPLLIVEGAMSRRGEECYLKKKKKKKATKGIPYLQDVHILSYCWSGPGKMPAAGGILLI